LALHGRFGEVSEEAMSWWGVVGSAGCGFSAKKIKTINGCISCILLNFLFCALCSEAEYYQFFRFFLEELFLGACFFDESDEDNVN
jgi:hypothetical protein